MGLEAILIAAATRIGAPLVKSILEKKIGGRAGEIGGAVIDAIAGKAGTVPDDLPKLPEAELDDAIAQVEAEAPDLIAAYVEQQREQNRLQIEEMKAEPAWTWAWRPAGMWMFNALVVWYVALVPLANLIVRAFGGSSTIELIVDVGTFASLYFFFAGFYMGGHTAKDFFGKAADAIKTWKARA